MSSKCICAPQKETCLLRILTSLYPIVLRGFDALTGLCGEKVNEKRAGGMGSTLEHSACPTCWVRGEKMLAISNDYYHQSSNS